MRRSTGMIIGLALAAAGAAQAQPVPQDHVPRFAPPGQAPQPYVPPGQAPQGQAPMGQAPQDFRPAQQVAPQQAPMQQAPMQQAPFQQAYGPPAPQGGPAPNYESWGDDQNGGYRYSWGDPNGPDYYEEEFRRQAVGPDVYQPPAYDYAQSYAPPMPCNCGGYGGYQIPTYGYASQNYGWPGQGCCASGGGEVSYSSSSSSYSSGVGGYLADGVWPGEYWPGGYWPGGSWNGGYMSDGRFVGARRWDYDSGWRNPPGRPVVAPR